MLNQQVLLDAITLYKKLDRNLLVSVGAMYYQNNCMYRCGDYEILYKVTDSETSIQVINAVQDRLLLFIENIRREFKHQIAYYSKDFMYSSGEIIDVWFNNRYDLTQLIYTDTGPEMANFFLTEEERFQQSCISDIDYDYIAEYYRLIRAHLPNTNRCAVYGEFISTDVTGKFEFKGLDYETL